MKRRIGLLVLLALLAAVMPACAEGVTYYGHVYSEFSLDIENHRVYAEMTDDGRAFVRIPEDMHPGDFAYKGIRITLPAQTVFFGTNMDDADEITPLTVEAVPLVAGMVRGAGVNYLSLDVTEEGPMTLDEPQVVSLVLTDRTVMPEEILPETYAAVLYDENTSEALAVFIYDGWSGFRPIEGL